MVKLLIMSTPRTGSNLLCELLTLTGRLGHVDGLFLGHGNQPGFDFSKKVSEYEKDHQSPDGHYATKVLWDYWESLLPHTKYGEIDEHLAGYTHYLHLRRNHKIEQAVSWYIALRSGKWTSKNQQKNDMPEYDYKRILWLFTLIHSYEKRTQMYISPMNDTKRKWTTYEFISNDYLNSVNQILTWLNLEPMPNDWKPAITLEKQENSLKPQYAQRFDQEFYNMNYDYGTY